MKKYIIAEVIGTFIIVFIGTGAIVLNEVSHGSLTHVGVCLLWGFGVALAIALVGRFAESHFNPAVTIALIIAGKFSPKRSIIHITSQISGAAIASIILLLLAPKDSTLGSTLPSVSPWVAGGIEIVISFVLMVSVALTELLNIRNRVLAAILVGSAVTLTALFAGPLTGASMNPARSIAPAFISGHTEFLWLYILAPIIGMIAAVPLYRLKKADSN
ncbi:MAG: aquaporin [Bacteroidota bacterium]|nr:aquaporin [Bacteroidota bacterium]MDP4229472.1 aquaporin [Bacteroidota bacterium]MDP4236662.1 aquaporin [Bacteroidota bacterium]